MSIESKIPQGEINIQDLHLEKPEKAEGADFFDAEKEITPEMWMAMETVRGQLLMETEIPWAQYERMTYEMRLLKPDSKIKLDDRIHTPSVEKGVQDYFYGQVFGIDLDSEHKEKYRQLQVGLFWQQVDERNTQNTVNAGEAKELLQYCQKVPNFHAYMRSAKASKQLFPSDFQNYEFAEEIINSYKTHLIDKPSPTGISDFGIFLKLCSKDFKLPDGLYKKLHGNLDEFVKQEGWRNYSELAAALKIITAEKVVITDAGTQLEMPGSNKHITEAPSPLPKVKKF